MTAATLTLADFLLARIAEDEAVAGVLADRRADSPSPMSQFYGRSHFVKDPTSTTRTLAECKAKRAIVEDFAESVADVRQTSDHWALGEMHALKRATIALAAVYADHDEFDPRWTL